MMKALSCAIRCLLTAILTLVALNADGQLQPDREISSRLIDLRLEIHEALDMIERGQIRSAEGILMDAQRSPLYPLLERDYHDYVTRGLLAIAALSDDLEDRYADLARFGQTNADPGTIAEVIKVAQSVGNHDDLINYIVMFLEQWPDQLQLVDEELFAAALEAAYSLPDMPVSFDELVAQLEAAALTNGDLGLISRSWRQFALSAIQQGDLGIAESVLERTLSVDVLVTMLVDSRFDAIWENSPDAGDLGAAMEREIEWQSAHLAENADRIEAVRRVAASLRRADLLDDALVVIDGAIQRILAPGVNPETWVDLQEQFSWLLNDRANVLLELGNIQGSIDQLSVAAGLPQNGQANVSQKLNYAALLVDVGLPDEAQDALSGLGRMSEYGEMVLDFIELGIAVQNQEDRKIRRLMEALERRRSVSLPLLQSAYLVIGDLDSAAGILIERLLDESQRYSALLSLQHFVDKWAHAGAPEFVKLRDGRFESLRERADVRAAIDEVGRVRAFAFRLQFARL